MHKTSDHDAVQITLRGTLIPRPQPRSTLRPSTLSHPTVKEAMHRLLAGTPTLDPDSADALWTSVLEIGLTHQRCQAKQRAKRRAGTLKHIRRLQEKIGRTPSEAARARSRHTPCTDSKPSYRTCTTRSAETETPRPSTRPR